MPQSGIVLVALLFVDPERRADFERFEARAAVVLKRHGAAIERRVGFPGRGGEAMPHELHLVRFPSRDALERYRADPELATLAPLRAAAIRRTVVWEGIEEPPFASG
jgi:uncharacterized protein (DUF1330 family)